MNIFKKIRETQAQHAIEYTILMTLIMAGIIIVGPYVVRSWNANLKGWDDSVTDSIQDPLLEVPAADAPIEGCNPDPETNEGCGLGMYDVCTGSTISCGPLEMLVSQKYNPPGCRCTIEPVPPIAECKSDNSCCSYTPGACGINGGCPDGQRAYTETCGSGSPASVCGYVDPPGSNIFTPGATDPLCVFQCQGSKVIAPTIGYDNVCPNDEIGLSNNTTNYSYVNNGGCTATKCQIECAPSPFVSKGTYCDCPSNKVWDGSTCVCPTGTIWDGISCVVIACTWQDIGANDPDWNHCFGNFGESCRTWLTRIGKWSTDGSLPRAIMIAGWPSTVIQRFPNSCWYFGSGSGGLVRHPDYTNPNHYPSGACMFFQTRLEVCR